MNWERVMLRGAINEVQRTLSLLSTSWTWKSKQFVWKPDFSRLIIKNCSMRPVSDRRDSRIRNVWSSNLREELSRISTNTFSLFEKELVERYSICFGNCKNCWPTSRQNKSLRHFYFGTFTERETIHRKGRRFVQCCWLIRSSKAVSSFSSSDSFSSQCVRVFWGKYTSARNELGTCYVERGYQWGTKNT